MNHRRIDVLGVQDIPHPGDRQTKSFWTRIYQLENIRIGPQSVATDRRHRAGNGQ